MTKPRHFVVAIAAGLLGATSSLGAQESNEVVLSGFKPTLSGYTNTASVWTDKIGKDKIEKTVFRRDRDVLVAAKGGLIYCEKDDVGVLCDFGEYGKDRVKVKSEHGCIAIDGDAIDGDSGFVGNLDFAGSTYTFLGSVKLAKHRFASDEKHPLVFELVKGKGLVHLKGSGTVTLPDGKVLTIPRRDK